MQRVPDGLLNWKSIYHGQEGVGQGFFCAVALFAVVLCRLGMPWPSPRRDA